MMQDIQGAPAQGPAAGGAPHHIVVLLHGYGADGNDLIALAPAWAEGLPHALFVAPHAPAPLEAGPWGRQWFSLRETTPRALLEGARTAAPVLDSFLDRLLKRHGLTDACLALCGFSQGCMMALHVGLRRKSAPAAILGYSGALVGGAEAVADITSRPPVMLVHGTADSVVPFAALGMAKAALAAAAVPVETLPRAGLAHGIDEEGLEAGRAFLMRHLPGAPSVTSR
jgi:phospholipase/carboxylesterase